MSKPQKYIILYMCTYSNICVIVFVLIRVKLEQLILVWKKSCGNKDLSKFSAKNAVQNVEAV